MRAAAGSSAVARNSSHVIDAAPRAALRMPTFASSSCAPAEGERGDEQRDGEADAGDRAAAGDGRPADRRPQPPAAQPGHEPRRAEDADRLADDVAEQDPERDRRA